MELKFETGKEYTTRDGRKAKVYEVYDSYIHGAILLDNSHWSQRHWQSDGRTLTSGEHGTDLILPKPKPREWRALVSRATGRIYWSDGLDATDAHYEIIKVREVLEDD